VCSRARGVSEEDLVETNATFVCPGAIVDLRAHVDQVLEL
jgi:hypothetical protein